MFVRATLSAVHNNQLLLTTPMTKGSRAWVALSDRAADALEDRAGSRGFGQITPAGVFHRHGRPLHPKTVLDRFHLLCDKAGVPRIALHDLRHLAARFALAAGVPLPVVSKPLRHRTLSTPANVVAGSHRPGGGLFEFPGRAAVAPHHAGAEPSQLHSPPSGGDAQPRRLRTSPVRLHRSDGVVHDQNDGWRGVSAPHRCGTIAASGIVGRARLPRRRGVRVAASEAGSRVA
ncbi:tyrosine-type recombinase/integrase [Kitasatospora sp. NPDC048538]|uniref:tyrosine-type recombinase/integrase n=1 Tax=Kitasatospora sp. NPDC048538 TaxID=3155633 RepID=UPI0033D0D9B1